MPLTYPDPIHGIISVPDIFRSVVESQALSRLRNIRQLGFTLATYSGAVHTRFEHTLGTVAVLVALLDQLGVKDPEERNAYIFAGLLSEIGIYPLSYSTRPIYQAHGKNKHDYARAVYEGALNTQPLTNAGWAKLALLEEKRCPIWFQHIIELDGFDYLDPIKLASTIDYVLRDSHYTGRAGEGFDYRFFCTLDLMDGPNFDKDVVIEALQSLHRAVHALNPVYGDPLRRGITAVLADLVDRLVAHNFLDISELIDPSAYIYLDDDLFFGKIASAVDRATHSGDSLAADLFEVVLQRTSFSVQSFNIETEIKHSGAKAIRQVIAHKLNTESERVFPLGDDFERHVGFRLFGHEFSNYKEALHSDLFKTVTGLSPLGKIELEDTKKVLALLVLK